jgi:hypothetical protein
VVLGAFLAWLVRVYVSNRVTRDQALLPVAADLERLHSLGEVLKRAAGTTDAQMPKLTTAVQQWEHDLSPSLLEATHGLPAAFPSPFATFSRVGGDYQTFLTRADSEITLLNIFITNGVGVVLDEMNAGTMRTNRVATVLASIDAAYSPGLDASSAFQKISILISAERAAVAIQHHLTPVEVLTEAGLTVNKLSLEIRSLNSTAWIVLLLAAALGSIVTLVLKPGFGKVADYLLCFTTSFGVPIIGGAMFPTQGTSAVITSSPQPISGSRGSIGL